MPVRPGCSAVCPGMLVQIPSSMAMISITIGQDEVSTGLQGLAGRLEDASPAFQAIGHALAEFARLSITDGRSPLR